MSAFNGNGRTRVAHIEICENTCSICIHLFHLEMLSIFSIILIQILFPLPFRFHTVLRVNIVRCENSHKWSNIFYACVQLKQSTALVFCMKWILHQFKNASLSLEHISTAQYNTTVATTSSKRKCHNQFERFCWYVSANEHFPSHSIYLWFDSVYVFSPLLLFVFASFTR